MSGGGDFHSQAGRQARIRLSNIRLHYVKKTPISSLSLSLSLSLSRVSPRSVGRSHAPSSLISLLFCSAAAKRAFSSLHYYCPLLHTVSIYRVQTCLGSVLAAAARGDEVTKPIRRLFGHFVYIHGRLSAQPAVIVVVVSGSLAPLDPPSVHPSISFPLLHRLIRPIFLPLTMGSLSALRGAREREGESSVYVGLLKVS